MGADTERFFSMSGVQSCSPERTEIAPLTLASGPGEHRTVVILLRGAMDGLDVVRPVGDASFADYRPGAFTDANHDLNGFFQLHPALARLMPLWTAGELSFAHAVSTPYRNVRSHFEGQDILETGVNENFSKSGGWLNRAMALLDQPHMKRAISVGNGMPLILSGEVDSLAWSPASALDLSAESASRFDMLYGADETFRIAFENARSLAASSGPAVPTGLATRGPVLANIAARQLRNECRFASFSVGGWDMHAEQENAMPIRLAELSDTLLTLKSELAEVWAHTAVLCITEFGRTVVGNGTGGTDHGTGSAAIFAGGAIAGSRIHTVWPGLEPGDLYQGRDLLPTADVRSYLAWVLHALYPLSRHDLEQVVFPGLDMSDDLQVIA